MSKYTWSWVTCAFNSLGSKGLIILYNEERAREIEKRNKNRQGEEKGGSGRGSGHKKSKRTCLFQQNFSNKREKIVKSGLSGREPSEHRKPTVVQSSGEEESFVGIQCCRETGKTKY